jgi:F-type H+-transporting ATPase subunit epsilon
VPLQLTIVTADRPVLTEEVDMVIAPGAAGELGILPRHEPLLTTLKPGELRVLRNGDWDFLAVAGGFMQVDQRGVTILADAAERVDEIDEARAQEARRLAQAELEAAPDLQARAEAQMALLRAIARISVVERRRHGHPRAAQPQQQ